MSTQFTQASFVDKNLSESLDEIIATLGPSPVLLNLGSGQRPRDGFINVDLDPGADVRANLFRKRLFKRQYRWPFKTGSVDLVYASHFLEHVPDWDAFWREMYRVVKPGGYVVTQTPYYTSVRAFQDPDHKQHVSGERFAYLDAAWRAGQRIDHYGAEVDFKRLAFLYWFHDDFRDKDNSVIAYAMKHFNNVVEDFAVILQKPERA